MSGEQVIELLRLHPGDVEAAEACGRVHTDLRKH